MAELLLQKDLSATSFDPDARDGALPDRARTVIVGAGVAGSSVAYHLAELGERDILLLERHIEDVCREMRLFSEQNDALLEELIGLTLRDYVINQLILESDDERFRTNHLTWNEFDVPATLVPERETELQNLLHFTAERLKLGEQPDLSGKIRQT